MDLTVKTKRKWVHFKNDVRQLWRGILLTELTKLDKSEKLSRHVTQGYDPQVEIPCVPLSKSEEAMMTTGGLYATSFAVDDADDGDPNYIDTTSIMLGTASLRRVSMPIFKVMVELGQPAHEPCINKYTMPASNL